MRHVEREVWISPNGKWKIFYQIVEQDGFYSIDTALSLLYKGHWKRHSTNKKLPKYVNDELVKIFNHYDFNFRFKKILL